MASSKIWTYDIPYTAPQVFQSYQLGAGLHEVAESIARTKSKRFDVVFSPPWNLSVLNAVGGIQGWVAFYDEALQIKKKFGERILLWPVDEFLFIRHKTKLPSNTVRQAQLLSLLKYTAPKAFSVFVALESQANLKSRPFLRPGEESLMDIAFVQELFLAIEQPALGDIERINAAHLNELSQRVQMEEVQIQQLLKELDTQFSTNIELDKASRRSQHEADKILEKEVTELKAKLYLQTSLKQELKAKEDSLNLVKIQLAQLNTEIQAQMHDSKNMKNEISATTDLLKQLVKQI